jgi:hypothetical protein
VQAAEALRAALAFASLIAATLLVAAADLRQDEVALSVVTVTLPAALAALAAAGLADAGRRLSGGILRRLSCRILWGWGDRDPRSRAVRTAGVSCTVMMSVESNTGNGPAAMCPASVGVTTEVVARRTPSGGATGSTGLEAGRAWRGAAVTAAVAAVTTTAAVAAVTAAAVAVSAAAVATTVATTAAVAVTAAVATVTAAARLSAKRHARGALGSSTPGVGAALVSRKRDARRRVVALSESGRNAKDRQAERY